MWGAEQRCPTRFLRQKGLPQTLTLTLLLIPTLTLPLTLTLTLTLD